MTSSAQRETDTGPAKLDSFVRANALEQLETICAHSLFVDTTRMKRFLRYIVEEALDGREHLLKGYSIGLEVFDRPESFDPQADTIVRVQAGQLRRRLDLYYAEDGRSDSIRILVPKGAYVPHFEMRKLGHSPEASPVSDGNNVYAIRERAGPGIIVTTLESLGAGAQSGAQDAEFAQGITAEIVHALTRFSYLRIITRNASVSEFMESLEDSPEDLASLGRDYDADFLLAGSVRRAGDVIRITVTLIETATGKHIYSHRYDREYTVKNLFDLQENIASYVAAAIAAPYGVVNRLKWSLCNKEDAALDARSYEALLAYYALSYDPNSNDYNEVLARIDAAMVKNPRGSSLLAARSLLLSAHASQDPKCENLQATLKESLANAQWALAIDSRNAVAYKALFSARFHLGDMREYRAAADKAISLNPNDDSVLAFYGVTLAFLGEYEKAVEYTRRADKLNIRSPYWYYLPVLFKRFMDSEYEDLTVHFEGVTSKNVIWAEGIAKAVYGMTGDVARLKALEKMRSMSPPALTQSLCALLECWSVNDALKAKLKAGWDAADALL